MSDEEQIEAITKISSKDGSKKIAEFPVERVPPNKEKFDAAMQNAEIQTAQVKAPPATNETSLIDEMRFLNRHVDNVTQTDPRELADQSKGVIARIEEIKGQLSDPELEIKGDFKRILRNKLEHIDGNLKIALEKAGIPYVPPEVAVNLENNTPIKRFLGLLTGGQEHLKSLGSELELFANGDKNLNPARLMMIQIKVNYVQQEIEFFSSLLNKALESAKTIMNVQV